MQTPQINEKIRNMIKEVRGDLFAALTSVSLAHCISADCKLGAGIAKIFRQKFGRIDQLKSTNAMVGEVAPLLVNNRFVYNLVTKEHFWEKPTYESLKNSLIGMKDHAMQHNVIEICMPRIGCGLDRLEWNKVKSILEEVFGNGSIVITVYSI